MFDTFTQKMRDYTAAYTKTVDAGFKHMYEKKTREYPLGCLDIWVQIYTSTVAWYGRLGIRIPFYNMLQMARLEVQFGNPDYNKEIQLRNVSIKTGKSKSPSLTEAIISSYIIIMYRCMSDPGYLNMMSGCISSLAGSGYGCVSLACSNRPGYG